MDGLQAPPAEPGTAPRGDDSAVDPVVSAPPSPAPEELFETRPGAGGRGVGDEEIRLNPRLYRLMVVGAVAVVAAGLALRFVASSDMWLDEALTLNISPLPLGQIHDALRRDGAPPLYYYLLHFWVGAFGTTDTAVRALSGVLSCATLPFIWLAGRRLGGRMVAAGALVLVATSPFAIRYATENRMYALVGLLTAAGVVALQHVLRRRTPANVIAVALVTGLLLYTHYWALYLVGVTALWLAWQAWWGPRVRRPGARVALGAVVVGCVSFVPWIPTFLYQAHHTGTPWAKPANFAAMVNAVTSFAGGATNQGRALALVYFALVGLGLFGIARGSFHVDLDLRTRPRGRALAIVLTGTLAAAVVGGYASRSAFQARYASVVFVPLVLLAALGLVTFADRRIRAGVLAATVAFGLASGLPSAWTSRTQAGQVATTLAQLGRPGDIVAFCPDQIGPSVNRLVPPGRYREITFPRGTGPEFVNWVDYAAASQRGRPGAFATELEHMSAPTHQIWLVWAPGYQTFGTKCEQIEADLLSDRSLGAHEMFPYAQVNDSWITYESMELVRFVHNG
ncbi:MAG TPA: glycosyltransferase family 39 protein [Acidimicrobiales bacterium]|nr:glycosyltransferase family 39 protein [Acidimicrobiales bacterium]